VEGTAERREGAAASANLKDAVASAHAALAAHASKIDALNVYPVPDGDTGTNMLLTLRSILEKVSASPGLEGEEAAKTVSRAALMGARGNSGVILSQIVRGACEVLSKSRALGARELSAALLGAREKAYATVSEPVEGTMLSVIKDAAGAAQTCVERGENDRLEVLRTAAREAHASVKRTPELLDVLAEAGVVDAGGLGVAVILDGLVAALGDEKLASEDLLEKERPEGRGKPLREAIAHSAEEAWGYCTEFFVDGFSGDEKGFEARIHELGESVLVIPDDDFVKVHLHTQDPGGALTYASAFGRLSDIKVEDMEAQTRARVRGRSQMVHSKTVANIGVVATSLGMGNRELFGSMGAVVVEGGQAANPSAEELVRAVEATGAEDVILLPNNKNVIPTAERLGELVEARVHIVPTTSIAGGLAAMVGFDPEGEPDEVVEDMRELVQEIRCAEVTRAVRNARVNGREVREGAYLGLLEGELLVAGDGLEAVVLELVGRMLEEGADVVTLLRGEDLGEANAERIASAIRRLDPGLLVEVKYGGQPLYLLQMVVE
jgi:DAK2 domain fusion protein YloV